MTKYLNDAAFTVGMPTGQRFRDNWDRIFAAKKYDVDIEKTAEPAVAIPEEPKKEG